MKNPIATIQGVGRSPESHKWTLLCFFIFLLQILLFAADPATADLAPRPAQ